MKQGLQKVWADSRDHSLIKTFGATPIDVNGLPSNFSIYDGRLIPNQDASDDRFTPSLIPLPYGCTGETGSFDAGIQDSALYNPQDLYESTPGNPGEGRDIRKVLKTLITRGPRRADGSFGPKRTNYFNVYPANKIDDFDAVRIALWINQEEKRGVWVGTWWYPQFAVPNPDGTLPTPSFNIDDATLHCHLLTGWKTINGEPYLEDISWQGMNYGDKGKVYFSRTEYNALINQPYTGAFTITKVGGQSVVTVGMQAYVDQLVAFIRNLFGV